MTNAALLLLFALSTAAAEPPSSSPFEGEPAAPVNAVDQAVFAQLQALGMAPARLSSDAVFVRRVYLDVIGTLPTADEARAFIVDAAPNKRATLIDRLLARPEFADYWALRWADTLRVKSEFPINLWPNAVQAYHRWIRASLRDGVTYDRFARALLTANGSNFRDPPVNFYRAVQGKDPQSLAATVALTFMGTRVEYWPADRLSDMSVFFSQVGFKATGEWKEEIVFFDPEKPLPGSSPGVARAVRFPDGSAGRIPPGQDPREVFADWLVSPKNSMFTRAIANRAWFWLLGRGVVDEPDDLRPDNPPSNPELLTCLEHELVRAHFDLKQLLRFILNSATYQLSSIPRSSDPHAEASFAHAIVSPLDAEVLIDALNQITGGTEQYSSAIPEPYTFIPPEQRSIALADGSITSAFLETFGRPSRDTGLASERSDRPTASQRLFLLNSAEVQQKLQQGPRLKALLQAHAGDDLRTLAIELYLTILSRPPTDAELSKVRAYFKTAGLARWGVAQDVAWALVNSAEFRYRH